MRESTVSCRNCGEPIILGPPTPDPYWYHPRNQSVYCKAEKQPPSNAYWHRATPRAVGA